MGRIEIPGKTSRPKIDYLFSNPGFMQGEYLGDVLDSCRWGSPMACMWERGEWEMESLVHLWIGENQGNLPFLFVREYDSVKLPRKSNQCDAHPNAEKQRDMGGTLRCMHVDIRYMRPSFIRGDEMWGFYEHVPEPHEPCFGQWLEERPSAKVVDPCYLSLEDESDVLSLGQIFHRLNRVPRHTFDPFITFERNYVVEANGQELARYARAWFEQEGDVISVAA